MSEYIDDFSSRAWAELDAIQAAEDVYGKVWSAAAHDFYVLSESIAALGENFDQDTYDASPPLEKAEDCVDKVLNLWDFGEATKDALEQQGEARAVASYKWQEFLELSPEQLTHNLFRGIIATEYECEFLDQE